MNEKAIEKAKPTESLVVLERVMSMLSEWTYSINEASKLDDIQEILDRKKAMSALLETRAAARALGDKLDFYKRKVAETAAIADRKLGELARALPEKIRATEVKKIGVTPKHMQEAIKASELPKKQFDGYIKATERESSLPRTKDVARLAGMPPAERKKAFAAFGESSKVRQAIESASKSLPEYQPTPPAKAPAEPAANAAFVRLASSSGLFSRKSAEFHREAQILAKVNRGSYMKIQSVGKELRALHGELNEAYQLAVRDLNRLPKCS